MDHGRSITIPEPSKENTPRDELVLEYLDNFRRQFVQLYPDRPELFLHPKNEHGYERFATTFIKPTKLPYKDVYDYPEAARFIADHLMYGPLSPPPHTSRSAVEPPKRMMSPAYVLEHRTVHKAHSFEYATMLVSILLGVGYDAYCVYGYASKAVTLNDQTQREPPFPILSSSSIDDNSSNNNEPTTYESLIAKKPYFQSQYLKNKEEKELQQAMQKASLDQGDKDTSKGKEDKDAFEGYRIHCWVLLLPGKRMVEAPIFIEPTTGLVFPSNCKDYIGIEAVWNESNYWLNMQTIRPTDLGTLTYELGNNYKWEPLFLDPDTPIIGKPPAKYTIISAGDKSVRKDDPERGILRCPTTWVNRIEISKHEFLTRFPNGEMSTDYKLCTVSRYAEYRRDDGMVMHVVTYTDESRKDVKEVLEFFANRKDFLEQRRRAAEGSVREIFGKGRPHGLKEFIKTPEKNELMFNPSVRMDGLGKRSEFFGRKTAETYEGREDFLVYRCVAFSNDKTMESIRLSDTEVSLPMRKITEKFDRNPDILADEDVQKIVFAMDQKKIFITYHRAEGRITAATRIYTKEGKSKNYLVDPFGSTPTARQLASDFQKITALERDCIQKLRDTDREACEIIKARVKEEESIELTTNIYDTWRGGKKKAGEFEDKWKGEEEDEQEIEENGENGEKGRNKLTDPIGTFMHLAENKPMTRESAQLIKEAAMRALKERLIQKANLIHARLEKETNALLRLQSNHQRGKDNYEMPAEDDVEYERQTHETMFRIRVLEERLTRHEKMAIEKFHALDQQVSSDPRVSDYL